MSALLSVEGLATEFETDEGRVRALDGVSFELLAGGSLGIVGESGCGKSVSALSIMGLLPKPSGKIQAGQILFKGEDLAAASSHRLSQIRGAEIGMVFQEPMTALNPVHTIGRQLTEAVALHTDQSIPEQIETAIAILQRVGIPEPELRMTEYPHQLSGGMRQRIVIAIALICEPELLIADEPTTALDVTIQAQILELLADLKRREDMAMLFITHDLGIVRQIADRVCVMQDGIIVETGPTGEIFAAPSHPYTQKLLAAQSAVVVPQEPGYVAMLLEAYGARYTAGGSAEEAEAP